MYRNYPLKNKRTVCFSEANPLRLLVKEEICLWTLSKAVYCFGTPTTKNFFALLTFCNRLGKFIDNYVILFHHFKAYFFSDDMKVCRGDKIFYDWCTLIWAILKYFPVGQLTCMCRFIRMNYSISYYSNFYSSIFYCVLFNFSKYAYIRILISNMHLFLSDMFLC